MNWHNFGLFGLGVAVNINVLYLDLVYKPHQRDFCAWVPSQDYIIDYITEMDQGIAVL